MHKIVRVGLLWLLLLVLAWALSQATASPVLSTVRLPSGQTLPLRSWLPEQPPQMVVIGVHGFNDYSAAFAPLAHHLNNSQQAAVYAFDQASFGANPNHGTWPGTEVLLQHLMQVVQHIKTLHPSLPVVVVGESMGAALVHMAVAQAEPNWAHKVVLLAPAVWGLSHMPWAMSAPVTILNSWAPNLKLSHWAAPLIGIRPTNDPKVLQQLKTDPLFIKRTTVNSLHGVATLMNEAFDTPLTPTTPTLVLYGLQDKIIPPPAMCRWLEHQSAMAQSTAIQFFVYPQGWHMLTRQIQAKQVLEDIDLWLQQLSPASPSNRQLSLSLATHSVCITQD